MMTSAKKASQRGNVVILILVAVGLFGALAYTFMRGSEQGQGNLTRNQANIAAQDILTQTRIIQTAIDKLRSRGCAEQQISFEVSAGDGYQNINSPPDKSCNVFAIEGGSITAPLSHPTQWNYNARNIVDGIGCHDSSNLCTELLLIVARLDKETCMALNHILHNATGDPPADQNGEINELFQHDGNFDHDDTIQGAEIEGKHAYCIQAEDRSQSGTQSTYHFYSVLLGR